MHRDQNVLPSNGLRLRKAYESLPRNEINHGLVDGIIRRKRTVGGPGGAEKFYFEMPKIRCRCFSHEKPSLSELPFLAEVTRR